MSDSELFIDGRRIVFSPDRSILEVATENYIRIPTLCHLKGATPTGACRICVVEVEGARTLLPATAGMKIETHSPKVVRARKEILELLLASGNHNCAAVSGSREDWTDFQLQVNETDGSEELCPVWGDCRLQDLAYEYQVSGKK